MYFVVFFFLFATVAILKWIVSKENNQPPAPWGIPFIGHTLFIGKEPAKRFINWKKKHGPVFQLSFPGMRVLVLNDIESIKECFSKSEFSGRRYAFKFMKWCARIIGPGFILNDGPELEEQRKFFLKMFKDFQMFGNTAEEHYWSEIENFRNSWVSTNGKYFELYGAFGQVVINCLWRALASRTYTSEEAHQILENIGILTEAETPLSMLSFFAPGTVNMISNAVTRKMEAYKFLNDIHESTVIERRKTRSFGSPKDILDVILDKAEGTSSNSGISALPKAGFTEDSIVPMLRDVLIGGSETVATTLEWFVLHGLANPTVVHKLENEIDTVIGRQRLPSVIDKYRMPYSMACILEVLRLCTVTAFAMPHCVMTDTIFRGWKIKKDTLVIANVHGVHHDPEQWESPEEFKPERFLTPSGKLRENAWSSIIPFSSGRRFCIGNKIAEDELFLIITSIYQKFSIDSEEPVTNFKGILGLCYQPQQRIRISVTSRT